MTSELSLNFKQDKNGTHFYYPNAEEPKLLLPRDKVCVNQGVNVFLGPKSRMKFYFSRFFDFSEKLKKRVSISDDIIDALQLSAKEAARCVVYIGALGPYRKYTLLQLGEFSEVLSISKFSMSDNAIRLIRNETSMLLSLKGKSSLNGKIPKVLSAGSVNSIEILKQSFKKGRKVSFLDKKIIVLFLRELQAETKVTIRFGKSLIYNMLHKRAERIKHCVSSAWKARILSILVLIDQYSAEEFVGVLAHRDFTKWNVQVAAHELFVYDWEFSEYEYPVLFDYFHFHLLPAAINGGLNKQHIKNTFFSLRKTELDWSSVWFTYKLQLIVYLFDVSLFYLESNDGKDSGDIVVQQYGEMLDSILENKLQCEWEI